MQNDEVIWQVIRHRHCSFMAKIETAIFCRNPYNVTGICNRSSCPLANSRYATIRDHDGVFYLYMKTIERAHQPTKLWERVKLPLNYEKALEIIDKHLMYWPKLLVHKVKQRLTKMYQMRIRMRKLALKTREKIMTTPRKDIKREARRAAKAELAAAIDTTIEKELVERLKSGIYKDDDKEIYNYKTELFDKVLNSVVQPVEEEKEEEDYEKEYVEGYDDLEEEDDMEDFGDLAIKASDDDDDGDDGTGEDDDVTVEIDNKRAREKFGYGLRKSDKDKSSTKSKKKPRVLIEVEHDDTDERQKAIH